MGGRQNITYWLGTSSLDGPQCQIILPLAQIWFLVEKIVAYLAFPIFRPCHFWALKLKINREYSKLQPEALNLSCSRRSFKALGSAPNIFCVVLFVAIRYWVNKDIKLSSLHWAKPESIGEKCTGLYSFAWLAERTPFADIEGRCECIDWSFAKNFSGWLIARQRCWNDVKCECSLVALEPHRSSRVVELFSFNFWLMWHYDIFWAEAYLRSPV